eukprot:TRINITY_DN9103_c0_g1_i1.p1 TRINITY_DN9103_c0_g1~~TRINITY_DN9103_c0_g1_i1.p1  ORF type:complete len:519 (+),score=88.57 TRINITY_DN9103_c0_g1_i1:102-1658(+)
MSSVLVAMNREDRFTSVPSLSVDDGLLESVSEKKIHGPRRSLSKSSSGFNLRRNQILAVDIAPSDDASQFGSVGYGSIGRNSFSLSPAVFSPREGNGSSSMGDPDDAYLGPAPSKFRRALSPVSFLSRSLQSINVAERKVPTESQFFNEKIVETSVRTVSKKISKERTVAKQVDFASPPQIEITHADDSPSQSMQCSSPYKTPKKSASDDDEDLISRAPESLESSPTSLQSTTPLKKITHADVEEMRDFSANRNHITRSQSFSVTSLKRRSASNLPRPNFCLEDDKENADPINLLRKKVAQMPTMNGLQRSASQIYSTFSLSSSSSSVPESECALPLNTTLPTIRGSQPDLWCINPETMIDVISGKYSDKFDQVHVIDCRFSYEYEGGHVRNAVNIPNQKDLQQFISKPLLGKVAIIFYCEFSSKRGPSGYRTLRKLDREANIANYPNLFYPEVYLLEGGYKNFFESSKSFCQPQNYVEMIDKRFFVEMKENCKELRQRSWKRSRSLTSCMQGVHAPQ